MNFDWGDREKGLKETVHHLFSARAAEPFKQMERKTMTTLRQEGLTWLQRLSGAGYLSLGLKDDPYGPATVGVQAVLAALSPTLYMLAETSTRIFGRLMDTHGHTPLKSRILPAIETGEGIGAVALSESGFHETQADIGTTGRAVSGGVLVSGEKTHVMNAAIADWIAVAGRVDQTDGAAFFLISGNDQGVYIDQRRHTPGYADLPVCPVTLEDCRVDAEHVIGPINDREVLTEVRVWEDQVLTAGSLGLMQRAFDTALSHAKQHQSHGKPLIAYQEVGFRLAEMLTLLQTAQLLAYRAAWMWETQDREAETLAHCAKVFCTESAEDVASKALDILGQAGLVQGNPAEQGYKAAKYLQVSGNASALARMKIAEGVLGG